MIALQYISTPAGKVRPPGHKVDTIIVHAMAEYIDYKGQRLHATVFLNQIGLSCHYMVTPEGSVIECAPPSIQTTYHAKGFNTHSIGIEILVPGVFNYSQFIKKIDTPWVSGRQMNATCGLVESCFNKHPIINLWRHSDVSPERKLDPGDGFNWTHLTDWVETSQLESWCTMPQLEDGSKEE